MKWLEITVRTPPEGVEAVAEIFNELGTGGVVIEDPALIYDLAVSGSPEEVAIKPEDISCSGPAVKGYLPVDPELEGRLAALRESLNRLDFRPAPEISAAELEESDWAHQWKKYYHTTPVGKKLLVKPSWEETSVEPGRIVLEMDPGMAFGCGTHPTTGLCLVYLEEIIRGGETVCDVGTGSGILAIAAAKLGASRVVAVDMDGVAVRVARENVAQNGVNDKVEVLEGNLLDMVKTSVDIVVANIVANVIIELAPAAASLLKPGGKFISSGIYRGREDDVRSSLAQNGFIELDFRRDGDWTAILAKVPDGEE